MVLITEENLKIMNSRTLALARRYLKQGCLKRIVVNELEKNAIYKVEGTIQVSSYENICHFFINVPLHSVYSTHCECPWYFDDEHICAHIGMLMIYLTKVDIQNFPYTSQKEASPYSLYNEDYLENTGSHPPTKRQSGSSGPTGAADATIRYSSGIFFS